jgi:hypothetical protein
VWRANFQRLTPTSVPNFIAFHRIACGHPVLRGVHRRLRSTAGVASTSGTASAVNLATRDDKHGNSIPLVSRTVRRQLMSRLHVSVCSQLPRMRSHAGHSRLHFQRSRRKDRHSARNRLCSGPAVEPEFARAVAFRRCCDVGRRTSRRERVGVRQKCGRRRRPGGASRHLGGRGQDGEEDLHRVRCRGGARR